MMRKIQGWLVGGVRGESGERRSASSSSFGKLRRTRACVRGSARACTVRLSVHVCACLCVCLYDLKDMQVLGTS